MFRIKGCGHEFFISDINKPVLQLTLFLDRNVTKSFLVCIDYPMKAVPGMDFIPPNLVVATGNMNTKESTLYLKMGKRYSASCLIIIKI